MKASIVFDTVEQQATAGVAISRELFRRLFIEDMLDELDTLKNILPPVKSAGRLRQFCVVLLHLGIGVWSRGLEAGPCSRAVGHLRVTARVTSPT